MKIDSNNYRYHGWFNGTISKMLQNINITTVDNTYPFEILLKCTCYVNCTFKCHTSN